MAVTEQGKRPGKSPDGSSADRAGEMCPPLSLRLQTFYRKERGYLTEPLESHNRFAGRTGANMGKPLQAPETGGEW